jgi:site-specific DNA recombinase
VAERHGWAIAEVYTDDDISAYSGKPRPSYRRLLVDIEAGRRDGLIVWHPDRLHRSPRELEEFIDLVERTSVPVGTVTAGEYDLTTPTGRGTARIVGVVARMESEHKSERLRRKALELAENGKLPFGGGRRPFGYEPDRVTVRQDEAVLIRQAAARVLSGDGLRTIVADWQARGIQPVSGPQWSTMSLRRLLRSGRITGWREHHGRLTAKAEWEAIIDADTGRRLRRVLDDPLRFNGGATARSYLAKAPPRPSPLCLKRRPTSLPPHRPQRPHDWPHEGDRPGFGVAAYAWLGAVSSGHSGRAGLRLLERLATQNPR